MDLEILKKRHFPIFPQTLWLINAHQGLANISVFMYRVHACNLHVKSVFLLIFCGGKIKTRRVKCTN